MFRSILVSCQRNSQIPNIISEMTETTQTNDDTNMSEFGLIARLAESTASSDTVDSQSVLVGIGDDAAVVSTPSGPMLLTTDAIVDGVHFRSVDERWFDVGWKCAVSNLSDIAAMGGVPDHALVTLGVPQGASIETYDEFYSGMNRAFEKFGGQVVGGDVVSSPTMFVNLALTGHPSLDAAGNSAWLERSAAQVNDLVCVTGPLGGSAGGLEILLSGDSNPSGQILIERHYRPRPRIRLGSQLVEAGVVCAMDISDGLVGDIEKLASASSVEITIEIPRIPITSELVFMFGNSAIELALSGGEDYELVFTAPQSVVENLSGEVKQEISVIGRVSGEGPTGGKVVVIDENGETYQPIRKGWDHLNV